ncbi:MAG TPA: transcriptional regulator [Verrucomicrobiales bacterium]|nr:transcriptional regulator [Verrucomicrobiales bacterium]HIL71501.1 transcriptional regulator [Verrucomicrobiota bacterium]
MIKSPTKADLLLEFARKRALFRAKDLREVGISTSTLSSAIASGAIERVNRGVYRHVDAPWDENLNLSEVAARSPRAVIVLISALNFHHIGTQQAHRVWIQLKQNAVTPRIGYPPIEVVRARDPRAFSEGVNMHELNGIPVSITNPARTVADCFKHRNKLGLELCLEALRETLRSGIKPAEVLSFARMNRVENVMMPYVEAMV